MTGRQRLLAILNRQPVDRLAWTTLVDDLTRSVMPPEVREMPVLDFYRHIGCDVLAFGDYGLPADLELASPARFVSPVETVRTVGPDDLVTRVHQTPWGTLTATSRFGHPVKHRITGLEDIEILTKVWAASRYEEVTDGTPETSWARVEAAIGDSGIYIPALDPSPVQHLLEYEMGPAEFYYLLQDYPTQVRQLLETMHACRLQQYEILARRSPAVAIIPVENTSTSLISPKLYRELSLPQIRDFCRIIQGSGKRAIIHMCGLLKGLLPEFADTGLDGIHALTPSPIGNLGFDEALDFLGDRLIILGGGFDGSIFQKPDVTRKEIWTALDQIYTPRLRRASFVLGLGADGLPSSLGRFLMVRDWMEKYGRL
jgi:hypothetical protein